MNSSHLATPLSSHHHHHNHHPRQQQHNSHPNNPYDTTKMSATNHNHNSDNNNNANSNHNNEQTMLERQLHNAGLSHAMARANAHHHTPTATTMNVGAGFTHTLSNVSAPTQSQSQTQTPSQQHKFAPARRLAARQTLRLAIPKQQGDTSHSNLLSNEGISQFRHSSPSQLPPAPILKRTAVSTTPQVFVGPLSHSHIPKSASPLDSHNLSNVGNNGGCMTATPSSGGSAKFIRVRNPSITLNSGDLCNQSDLFAFAKELSSPSVGDHSPIFAEISSSLSPATSSGSPSNHLNRLFNLSPSTLRNYGNNFQSDKSHRKGGRHKLRPKRMKKTRKLKN